MRWTMLEANQSEEYIPGLGDNAGIILGGQYIYIVPVHATNHNFLRYDRMMPLNKYEGWQLSVQASYSGYFGGCYDSQYVYYAPWAHALPHGDFLRFNTWLPWNNAAAWQTYAHPTVIGYHGAFLAGNYIYYVPYRTTGVIAHGNVCRYNRTGSFTAAGSWEVFDVCAAPLGAKGGYCGGVFDGRYAWFVPDYASGANHREFLRFDTTGTFSDPAAWEIYSPAVGGNSYRFGCTDGSYLYFAPWPTLNTKALRYDKALAFNNPDAWKEHNMAVNSYGCFFDGVRIRFVANDSYGVSYDTRMDWDDPTAWFSAQRSWGKIIGDPRIIGPYCDGLYAEGWCYYGPLLAGGTIRFRTEW